MKKALLIIAFLILTTLWNISYAMNGVSVNISMFPWITADLIPVIDRTITSAGNLLNNLLSKDDFSKITFQIRDDWEVFAGIIRNQKLAYKKTNVKADLYAIKLWVYNDAFAYCETRKRLENALQNAYEKDNQALFPIGYEKPWIVFRGADCKKYGIKILKYVMGIK